MTDKHESAVDRLDWIEPIGKIRCDFCGEEAGFRASGEISIGNVTSKGIVWLCDGHREVVEDAI